MGVMHAWIEVDKIIFNILLGYCIFESNEVIYYHGHENIAQSNAFALIWWR
jgi:hypothetical protein